ncbi:MAG TPA: hypothetical protein VLL05_05490 [Terriglobales bacterium]|nr:hypothetical protein [Terriglobales bacterium]
MSERKTRVWIASLMIGCVTSLILTAAMLKMNVAPWFAPIWPGLLLASLSAQGQNVNSNLSLALITAGNALFYGWLFLKIIRAEITARGHLSRYFLQ